MGSTAVVTASACAMAPAVPGPMATARTMAAAVAGPVVTMTRPVVAVARAVGGRPVVDRGPVNVDVPIDVDVAMVPAMPAGAAAPADPATPCVAAPVPARAPPGRIVPAVIPSAPDELRLFDGRAFDERGRRRERAGAYRGLNGKGELRHQSRRGGER
jgi:hypothetical protein